MMWYREDGFKLSSNEPIENSETSIGVSRTADSSTDSPNIPYSPPYALLAELTHRCPMRCLYCSNPMNLTERAQELRTEHWQNIFKQASKLGILQVHLSGGEPLIRDDLTVLVDTLSQLDLYSNLVTSSVGLTESKLHGLIDAGLNCIQVSIQSADNDGISLIGGADVFDAKITNLEMVKNSEIYLTINVVLSRLNIDDLDRIMRLCLQYSPNKIEIANCQFHGWARKNQSVLMPSLMQLNQAEEKLCKWREHLSSDVELVWVHSDFYSKYPKPCMGGWARRQLTVTPDGFVLPCPEARIIDNIEFENIREHDLDWIWRESESFNLYRGDSWMQEPCKSCEYKEIDFGGCRCQAFALTGDAARTDPVCSLSNDHYLIGNFVKSASDKVEPEKKYYRRLY